MKKICFVISSIGSEDSDIRIKADEKLEFLFEPTVGELGYECIRADGDDIPGSISRKMVQRILESDLVLADISDRNPNVFYELAIRNAANKPVIIIKEPGQKPPFDIQDTRAIDVDMTKPKIWHAAKEQLKKQIKVAESDKVQASLSILSDFNSEFKLESKKDTESELLRTIKDVQDQNQKMYSAVRKALNTGRGLPPQGSGFGLRNPGGSGFGGSGFGGSGISIGRTYGGSSSIGEGLGATGVQRISWSIKCKKCETVFIIRDQLSEYNYQNMKESERIQEKCPNCNHVNGYTKNDLNPL